MSSYKRFLAFGCSHGSLVDPKAVAKVAKFKAAFKPHTVIHLGDVYDFAAFRHGAPGTKDEAASLAPDINAGSRLIEELEPTNVIIGNHDVRVWKLADHPNAIIAHAAACCRNEFLTACERVHAKVLDTYDINKSWIELGDTKVLHGFMYNEMAMRDHAEHFGKCMIAHLHRAGADSGRRNDHPTCHCVGTLSSVGRAEYANTRRATARWSHGFTWGEYNDKECHVNLSQCPQGEATNWRLPL